MQLPLAKALGERELVYSEGFGEEAVVKSAARVLQVLSLFDLLGREATVSEIAQILEIPQSSTSVLLHCLVNIGYLQFNRVTRCFLPTTKAALLGRAVNPSMLGNGPLPQMMQRINRRTGLCTVLVARNVTQVEYIHVLQGKGVARPYLVPGVLRSIVASASGYCFLSEEKDANIKRIAMRVNAYENQSGKKVCIAPLLEEIQSVRDRGYAVTSGLVRPDRGMVARLLPPEISVEPLVIGLGGAGADLIENAAGLAGIILEEAAVTVRLAQREAAEFR